MRKLLILICLLMSCSLIIMGCGSNKKSSSPSSSLTSNVATTNNDIIDIPSLAPVGKIGWNMKKGGIIFINASQSDESTAVYGEGEDALYVKYLQEQKDPSIEVSGKNKESTTIIKVLSCDILKTTIPNEATLYIFKEFYDITCSYVIVGIDKNGKLLKYIDTNEISTKYYNNDNHHGAPWINYDTNIEINKNTLSLNCFSYSGGKNFPGDKLCRFNFTWNNKTKTFDIQQTDKQVIKEYTPMSIDTMLAELEKNPAAAQQKYKGKNLKITGKLGQIDSDGKYIILIPYNIHWNAMLAGLNVEIKKDDKSQFERLLNLQKGQNVTVCGTIDDVGETIGYSMKLDKFE